MGCLDVSGEKIRAVPVCAGYASSDIRFLSIFIGSFSVFWIIMKVVNKGEQS